MEEHDQQILSESRAIWDANAEAWDARIGSGGGWQTTLIAPTVERMLGIQAGERVLDVACGNGQFSRRLLELGASVIASDFSPKLIELAKGRTTDHADRITYHVADATDEAALLALAGEGERFDAVVCNNAIMDMPAIEPLFRAVAKLLKPEGRFVFTVMHPCFNGLAITMQPELPDYASTPTYSIKVSRYLSAERTMGLAISSQPRKQFYWHRPLHILLNSAFASGLVMDRIEEPSLKTDAPAKSAFDWANYDMPPLLFVRLRPARR
ncbi:MAG: class I SAM-dependent methyltransferase [Chloroflexi bacterium]|nr:class I SAM-dependent methyltransferase [Chloroflexota bacterium]MCC6892659.1 class I SAM-dependent methyltransferase [Anaerolineae bacterium]